MVKMRQVQHPSISVHLLLEFATLLRFERQRCGGARNQTTHADRLAGLVAVTVVTGVDAGDYGYCDETGEPIGVGRLLARPTATLSLEAQQRRELKQKMFGD